MRGAVLSLVICWSSAIALDAAAQQAPAPKPIPVAVKTTGATPKAVAPATQTAAAAPAKPVAKKSTKKPAANPAPQMVSDVAAWVTSSGDNRGLPFAIVDKNSAQVLIYDTKGKLRGRAPVLIGSAVGDQSAPGVGDRELKDIPMADRTTPAGRYLVGFGPAAGGEHVLWIDYNNAISMHAIPQTKQSVKEKRAQRLASKTSDDNRISHGCINVTSAFYAKVVAPTFRKSGGVFYVLPDTETLQEAIPAYGLNSVEAIAALEASDPVSPPGDDDVTDTGNATGGK